MAESVGSIYYEVEADTSKLVNSSDDVDKSLDSMNKRFGQTDKAARQSEMQLTKTASAIQGLGKQSGLAGTVIQSLGKLIAGVVSVRTAVAIVQMAESYNEMAERIKFATSSTSEYETVQKRLLDTANGTYRALSEAQEVYIMTADSLRSLGYSTDQVLDITDSLSYSFVKNATSTERASTAMSAYTKAVNSGKVEADGWSSIMMAIPTVVDDIAKATNKSTADVRALGFAGKLAAKDLNEGLRRSLDSNKAAADGMATTVKDSVTAVRNNLQVYVGEANRALGATTALSGAISDLAEVIRNADPSDLVREINAMKSAMEIVNEFADDWLKPFNLSTEESAKLFTTSFADSFLATGKEIDTIAGDFQGFFGGIQAAVSALGGNITTILSRAWNMALKDASEMLNAMIDGFNKVSDFVNGPQMGKVSFGSDIAQETVSLVDAYVDGYRRANKGVGAHAAILDKMADKVKIVTDTEWSMDYDDGIKKATASTTSLTDKTTKLTAAQKQAAKEQAANKAVLDGLAQSLLLAGINGEELAATKARLTLSPSATQEEVDTVDQLARALYQLSEAEKMREKVGETKKEKDKFFGSDVSPLSGGAFDDQTARYEAEAEAEIVRYEEQQKRLREALELQAITTQEFYDRDVAAAQVHADRMAQIDQAKTSVMLGSAADGFGALADIMKNSQGEQSSAYKAMFAVSKAFSVANASLALYTAISEAWKLPWPANIPAIAAATAAMGAVASNVSSVSMGGGRQYGGPVAPGAMHRINENGAPEVLNTANGRQYLLPNSRGEVVSNKDAQGGNGSAPAVTVNLIESQDRAGQVEQSTGADQEQVITLFVADIRGGGKASQTIERTYGLTRRGS